MLNQIVIMGRLTRDPELRRTNSGKAVCSFTVACERDFGTEKTTDFIDCVAWEKTGEFIDKYFNKGEMISVNGRLELRTWEDNNGNKRKNAEIRVERAYFCAGKTEKNAETSHDTFVQLDDSDTDLPF